MDALPPGPRFAPWHMIQMMREPYRHLDKLYARYGDPFTVPTVFGKMVFTGQPEGIKTIFTADPNSYVVISRELSGPVMGDHSLLLLDGDSHREERKLLQPPFHAQRMRAYGRIIGEIAARHAAAWPRAGSFDVYQTAREISLEVILQAVFGVTDEQRKQEVGRAILAIFDDARPSFLYFKWLRSRLWRPWTRFVRAREHAFSLLRHEIAGRRASTEAREDILSLLLEARYEDGSPMSEQQLLDELVTLLGGGYETTAASLGWLFHLVHRHPEVLARLRAELAPLGPTPDPAQLAQLPYLEAVCNESLRIYPLVSGVARRLARPLALGQYQLPAGTVVAASGYLAHRRAETFAEPTVFRPERFLERKPTIFEFLPFGGGARRCLGAALAFYEMKLVLGTVLAQHQLQAASAAPIREALKVAFIAPGGPVQLQRAA